MSKVHKILVIGGGGREHVLVWKLSETMNPNQIYVVPGNAGMNQIATCIDLKINDFESISALCIKEDIQVVLPGGEDTLVAGIRDYFEQKDELKHIYVFGPDRQASMLEGSKAYCKSFLMRHQIPTAAYRSFTAREINEAREFLMTLHPPYVLKADGLAAGKGVLILPTLEMAFQEIEAMLQGKFGQASETVVIEEFLDGIEFSMFVMTDGEGYVILPEAKDYKRIGEGDEGLNTGGMGAISPVDFVDTELMERVKREIIHPTMKGLKEENMDYRGFLFFGLINCQGIPKVIEYNVRMGDPETEVVFPRVQNTLQSLLEAAMDKRIQHENIQLEPGYRSAVFLVSGGYPEAYEKGKKISIQPEISAEVFHAGTAFSHGEVVSNGGRVIAVSASALTLREALLKTYDNVGKINFSGMFYRRDIGQDLLKLQSR